MSLERKDVRAKLDPNTHAALVVLCEVDQCDIGEFIERVLDKVVRERVHAATLIADRTARFGITGNRRESQGTTGSGRECLGSTPTAKSGAMSARCERSAP